MAGPQRNGIDATIALLLALAGHNGEAKASALRRKVGAPRARCSPNRAHIEGRGNP